MTLFLARGGKFGEQKELIEEFLINYHKLDEKIKVKIPLKQIWVLAGKKDD